MNTNNDDRMGEGDLGRVNARVSRLEAQVEKIDTWRAESVTRLALDAQQQIYLKERFDKVDREIGDLKAGLSWAVRIFLGAIVAAIAAFLVRGGFSLG